jgi:hypothetical protein
MLKLLGRISVSFDVETFVEAGDHQTALENVLATIRERYPNAALSITQRRERRDLGLAATRQGAVALESYQRRRR